MKDKFSVFKPEEYSMEQLLYLKLLYEKYPSFKWLQLLSPFHCDELYYNLCNMGDRESLYDQIENNYKELGYVTVYLEYAIKVCRNLGKTDILTAVLKKQQDADIAAKEIFSALNITVLPQRVYYMHRKEFNYDLYILRDMWTDEALAWCLDYIGSDMDNTNIVCIWNMYKHRYFKHLQEDFYED